MLIYLLTSTFLICAIFSGLTVIFNSSSTSFNIKLLHSNAALDLQTVFLLDKIQKKELISKEDFAILKKAELVEGRYPNIFVSYKVANIVGQQTDYVSIPMSGLSNRETVSSFV